MAQQGRILTVVGMYWRHTRNATLILRHLDKINAAAELLEKRRVMSLRFSPSDSRYGMLTGIDETDMW